MEIVEKFKHNGYDVTIEQDTDPESPRENDNVGTMVCWHRRSRLGDVKTNLVPEDYILENLVYGKHLAYGIPGNRSGTRLYDWYKRVEVEPEITLAKKALDTFLDKHYVILPLYLYEHSGMAMGTGPFSCPFDSGKVGFIYCDLETAKNELLYPEERDTVKEWTPELREKATKQLEAEVAEYSQYLQGDIYTFQITKRELCILCAQVQECDPKLVPDTCPHCDVEELDDCCGLYGIETARQEAMSVIEGFNMQVEKCLETGEPSYPTATPDAATGPTDTPDTVSEAP